MWFENIWEYLSEIGVSLNLDDKHHFKPSRIGDKSLMDVFFQHFMDHRQATQFNHYRHSNVVVRVSDILSCYG